MTYVRRWLIAGGLLVGAVLGFGGNFVEQDQIRSVLYALSAAGLILASVLLTIELASRGCVDTLGASDGGVRTCINAIAAADESVDTGIHASSAYRRIYTGIDAASTSNGNANIRVDPTRTADRCIRVRVYAVCSADPDAETSVDLGKCW